MDDRPSIRREDYGFFGPHSPSWKVWAAPTALIGFQRAVVLEHFDPYLAAAVADSAGIYTDPSGRLDRTLAYFLTVAVADGRTAIGVSDALMRIHARAKGIEPITGARLAAVRRVGAQAVPIYGTAEAGAIGHGCLHPAAPDEVHQLHDFHGVIQAGPDGRERGMPPDALLLTSLRPTTPLVLVNVALGDQAVLGPRA